MPQVKKNPTLTIDYKGVNRLLFKYFQGNRGFFAAQAGVPNF